MKSRGTASSLSLEPITAYTSWFWWIYKEERVLKTGLNQAEEEARRRSSSSDVKARTYVFSADLQYFMPCHRPAAAALLHEFTIATVFLSFYKAYLLIWSSMLIARFAFGHPNFIKWSSLKNSSHACLVWLALVPTQEFKTSKHVLKPCSHKGAIYHKSFMIEAYSQANLVVLIMELAACTLVDMLDVMAYTRHSKIRFVRLQIWP